MKMDATMQWISQTEEGMWAALRRHLIRRAASTTPGTCGLWKVRSAPALRFDASFGYVEARRTKAVSLPGRNYSPMPG